MNTQLLKKFSREILNGAASLGVVTEQFQGVLSSDQACMLEIQTGRAVGELAILGLESSASPEQKKQHGDLFRETVELMACLDHALRPASSKTVRKAAVR